MENNILFLLTKLTERATRTNAEGLFLEFFLYVELYQMCTLKFFLSVFKRSYAKANKKADRKSQKSCVHNQKT